MQGATCFIALYENAVSDNTKPLYNDLIVFTVAWF